jgi:hypothetical protein
MRRLIKFGLVGAIFLIPLCAQQTLPTPPLSPAMQGAIDRIIHGNPPPQIVPPGARLTELATNSPVLTLPAPVCSVPLLEMRVDHPEKFSLSTAPPPATNDPMPSTTGSAPPCAPAPAR